MCATFYKTGISYPQRIQSIGMKLALTNSNEICEGKNGDFFGNMVLKFRFCWICNKILLGPKWPLYGNLLFLEDLLTVTGCHFNNTFNVTWSNIGGQKASDWHVIVDVRRLYKRLKNATFDSYFFKISYWKPVLLLNKYNISGQLPGDGMSARYWSLISFVV